MNRLERPRTGITVSATKEMSRKKRLAYTYTTVVFLSPSNIHARARPRACSAPASLTLINHHTSLIPC